MNQDKSFALEIVGMIIVLILIIFFWYLNIHKTSNVVKKADYKNTSYSVENQKIDFVNGHSEVEVAPGSASKTVTEYFGNEAMGDLNNDGIPDVVFIITQTSGGSGTFYYVVASIKDGGGYKGTNAVFLGDRIAPQTTEIKDQEIIVNYADRKENEPMSAEPSVGVSKYLKVQDGVLVEVNK